MGAPLVKIGWDMIYRQRRWLSVGKRVWGRIARRGSSVAKARGSEGKTHNCSESSSRDNSKDTRFELECG